MKRSPLTDEQVEYYAIRIALGNNGGQWATHYHETHKDFWRSLVRELASDIAENIQVERLSS